MKIFSWMRNKRNGNEGTNKPNPESMSNRFMHQSCKEEFSDWPNGLLAIGTFGNNNLKHSEMVSIQGTLSSGQDHLENTTAEDFEEVDKELRLLLNEHISLDSSFSGEKHNLSVEELLDCLREDEKKIDESRINESENTDTHLQRTTTVVHRGRKDIQSDNRKRGIGKKSLSFLIKKALLCTGGFVPAPILRDPLPYPKLNNSRMEKILRAMLHKKIYPQRPSPKTTSPKKYLDMPETDSTDEEDYEEASDHKSKWVKTDSEYIVLEI